MSSGEGRLARLDDWFNPIVVKEVRQAVNGKFVSAVLIMLLIIQLVALGIFIVANGDFSSNFTAGQDAFMMLHGILLGISLLFIPAYAGIRLAFERSDTNVDLLFITTIKPISIIAGKMVSALVITALIFSACMPFMAFTYWLRGIDLPSVFILLAMSFLAVLAMLQITTFVACVPSRILKILLALGQLSLVPQVLVGTISVSFMLLRQGVGSRLGTWEFWGPAIAVLLFALALNGILFSLSVALITPPAANRALPVRIFVTIIWAVSGITSVVVAYFVKDFAPIAIWSIVASVIFSAAAFVAVSERETLGPRVARTIPANHARRVLAFLFYSGGAGGIIWCALLAAATFLIVRFSHRALNLFRSFDETGIWVGGLFLYALAYAMTGLFVRRLMLSRFIAHKYTWAVTMVLLCAGCTLPFLLSYLLFYDTWRAEYQGAWLLGNPFVLGIRKFQTLYVTFAGAWAAISVLVNLPWFTRQISGFQPWVLSRSPERD